MQAYTYHNLCIWPKQHNNFTWCTFTVKKIVEISTRGETGNPEMPTPDQTTNLCEAMPQRRDIGKRSASRRSQRRITGLEEFTALTRESSRCRRRLRSAVANAPSGPRKNSARRGSAGNYCRLREVLPTDGLAAARNVTVVAFLAGLIGTGPGRGGVIIL